MDYTLTYQNTKDICKDFEKMEITNTQLQQQVIPYHLLNQPIQPISRETLLINQKYRINQKAIRLGFEPPFNDI